MWSEKRAMRYKYYYRPSHVVEITNVCHDKIEIEIIDINIIVNNQRFQTK